MLVRFALVSVLGLTACADDGAILGPFTGETHRFVIDRYELPTSPTVAREVGRDLDGDEKIDNNLGLTIGAFVNFGGAQEHVVDMLAAGAMPSSIEIQADDLFDDESVGVVFYGRDGADARVIGGRLRAGVFEPNRIADVDGEHTGAGLLLVPAFADADPLELHAVTLQIELVPDGAGYDVNLAGAVRSSEALATARAAIMGQLANHPEDHRSVWTFADKNLDGEIPLDELRAGIIGSLLLPDVHLAVDGTSEDVLSFGFRMHAKPCSQGQCLDATFASCFDRVRNGDEADVDCGGSCGLACAGGRACSVAGDCQSQSCAAGTCAAVSCNDGVKNGLEASLDCGGACPTKCARLAVCGYDFDCASNDCTASTATGVCR